ncbi:MAG TPA: response regulator [Verrucomicrobiae bacterium]|jgi:PAS domain S-box-containing protein|nr:response regulator [Verrucomicrobiae bacterium]
MKTPTDSRSKRILVIDDNPAIHEDIRKILTTGDRNADMDEVKAALFGEKPAAVDRYAFEIDSALQGEEGLGKVKAAHECGRPYAMAFVDVRMPPGWDGVETISRIWKSFPDLQVVICTAYSDYSWEEMIQQVGPSDSLLILKKPFDNIEVLQMAHALTEKWALNNQVKHRLNNLDELVAQRTAELEVANQKLKREIAERIQAEQALRLSEERFSKAFKASPIPLAIQSLLEEKFVDANKGFEKLLGYSVAELVERTPAALKIWADPAAEQTMLEKLRKEMTLQNSSARFRNKAGHLLDILLSVEVFELNGAPYLLMIAQDITEQLKLENQLRQAQKMEAVGQLAAGVAHDFNNILTVISGNATLLLEEKPADSSDAKPLQSICAAADRASRLVRQLLTFSRKQITDIRPCQIREAFNSMEDMLPRVIGPQVILNINAQPGLPQIYADASMMETMLMNLAVNARDAMPEGGRLMLTALAVTLEAKDLAAHSEARRGRFVRISVADTGTGIPPEALPRIFEPFFTTKPVGQGTGLGLATVYGIVKQHRGWIDLETAVGKGTTFNIFIPVFESEPAETAPIRNAPEPKPLKKPSETILVVEDEPDLRDLVIQLLQSRGYRILAASSGKQALEQWAQHKDEIQLVLTDMVMPDGLTGRKLAEQLLQESPHLPIIYTSGYSPGTNRPDVDQIDPNSFLGKPYRPAELFEIIHRFLNPVEKAA